MEFWQVAIYSWFCGFAFLNLVFLYAYAKKRYDVIDSAWGMTFIVIAVFSFLAGVQADVAWLSTIFVIVWGLRLSMHIFARFLRSDREDPRYVELRKKWRGSVAVNTYFRIFLVQSVLAFLVSLPVQVINYFAENDWNILIQVGIALWLIGIFFEKVADSQLRDFVADAKNRGKIMNKGLWKYSRHPNYFGEITLWWGMFLVALGATGMWWSIIGPLTISILIIFVSGIPPSERRFEGKKGWKEYKSSTSVLVPLPPK